LGYSKIRPEISFSNSSIILSSSPAILHLVHQQKTP
jgi:hypothetical protein